MNVQSAYNEWAHQYDSNQNKTRDLEAISLRKTLDNISFDSCLEIGCGTGKNTEWLVSKAQRMVSVDLSEEMLAKAREKIVSGKVSFVQANILEEWRFAEAMHFDLAVFSLVLEHIEDLHGIFKKLAAVTRPGGLVYIGELHPFKQYGGTKARFETASGTQEVTCFIHHVSDFTTAASNNGFNILDISEYFDEDNRETIPRILTLLLQKQSSP